MININDTLKDYRVRTKISILSTFLLVIILLIAAIGVFSIYRSKESLDDMYSHNLMTTQYLNDANNRMRSISVNVSYILQQNFTKENRKLLLDDISGNLDNIRHDMEELKKIDTSERAQTVIGELEKNLDTAKGKVKAIDTMGTTAADKAAIFENLSSLTAISGNMAVLTPDNVFQGKQLFEANNRQFDRIIKIFLVIILIGLALGILMSRLIAENISAPLNTSIGHLNAVAAGKLNQEIPKALAQRQDEIGIVVRALMLAPGTPVS